MTVAHDLDTLLDLADRERATGRLDRACSALRGAFALASTELGRGDPTTTGIQAQLTRLLLDIGRDADAVHLGADHSPGGTVRDGACGGGG